MAKMATLTLFGDLHEGQQAANRVQPFLWQPCQCHHIHKYNMSIPRKNVEKKSATKLLFTLNLHLFYMFLPRGRAHGVQGFGRSEVALVRLLAAEDQSEAEDKSKGSVDLIEFHGNSMECTQGPENYHSPSPSLSHYHTITIQSRTAQMFILTNALTSMSLPWIFPLQVKVS